MSASFSFPRKPTHGELRIQAALLRRAEWSFAEIARVMKISPIRARDLYLQYEHIAERYPVDSYWMQLSNRAITALLSCENGSAFGATPAERCAHLLAMAESYRRSELEREQFVGRATIEEIQIWLQSHGRSFRSEKQGLSDSNVKQSPARPRPKHETVRRKARRSLTMAFETAHVGRPRRLLRLKKGRASLNTPMS